jgi:hypothetical protein
MIMPVRLGVSYSVPLSRVLTLRNAAPDAADEGLRFSLGNADDGL